MAEPSTIPSYLLTDKHLHAVADRNISWFSTFTTVCFPHSEAIYTLMRAFLLGENCFFFSGTFACHVAGILSGYKCACLYITPSDTYMVRLLFQRVDAPTFSHAGFQLELLNSVLHDELVVYKVSMDSFSMKFIIFGVEVSARCGPLSTVDFAYFIWDNFERISAKHYAITLLPSDLDSYSNPPPMINRTSLIYHILLCLKHRRAASEGWRDGTNCDTCVGSFQSNVGSKCGYTRLEDCSCGICLRQPLSLFASVLDVYTRMVRNLPGFELMSNTTYEQFVYAVESEETDIRNMLPPEFPEMRLWFRFSHPTFDRRFHRDCPGVGEWDSETCRSFPDFYEAIDSLVNEEETYWCHFCHRGLFFPNACPDLLHIN